MASLFTMYRIEENDSNEELTKQYEIPERAINKYLKDTDDSVEFFINEEYTSKDTKNIIEMCEKEKIPFKQLSRKKTGHWLRRLFA